jgi:dolichol-phosphate mannosyltransferase
LIKIILCAFNEAQNIKKLIPSIIHQFELMQREFEIIFCLDCSTDDSVEIIKNYKNQCSITILPIENKRGLGIAYKKAFLHVIFNCKADDLIISFDADCTHDPSQLPEMLKIFEEKNLDFMVASRFVNSSSIKHFPFYRKLISKTISFYLRLLFPIKNSSDQIYDYTSGYRIYRNSILQKSFQKRGLNFITEEDFTCLIEILIILNQLQLIKKFQEFPIQYSYGDKIGASKLRLFKNCFRLLILSLKLLMRR